MSTSGTSGTRVRVFSCIECGADVVEGRNGGHGICMCCYDPMCDQCVERSLDADTSPWAMHLCTPCRKAADAQIQATGRPIYTPSDLPAPPIQRKITWRYR